MDIEINNIIKNNYSNVLLYTKNYYLKLNPNFMYRLNKNEINNLNLHKYLKYNFNILIFELDPNDDLDKIRKLIYFLLNNDTILILINNYENILEKLELNFIYKKRIDYWYILNN